MRCSLDTNAYENLKHLIIDYIDLNLEKVNKTFAGFFKSEHGLSPNQMSVIWYLRNTESMTMGECAEKLHMSKQQATQLVNALVERELIKRIYTKENRRTIRIVLAQNGKEIIQDVENRYVRNFVKQCENFTEQEKNDFLQATATINRLLSKLHLGPTGK